MNLGTSREEVCIGAWFEHRIHEFFLDGSSQRAIARTTNPAVRSRRPRRVVLFPEIRFEAQSDYACSVTTAKAGERRVSQSRKGLPA